MKKFQAKHTVRHGRAKLVLMATGLLCRYARRPIAVLLNGRTEASVRNPMSHGRVNAFQSFKLTDPQLSRLVYSFPWQ